MGTLTVESLTPKAAPVDDRLQRALDAARKLLGVSEFSSKRFIKNAIYERFWRRKDTVGLPESQFKAAVALLLKHHKNITTKEAKAARAQEEADKKVRDEFLAKFYRVERAQVLVVDAELAKVRRIFRQVYDRLDVGEQMSFIKVAGNVFDLNRKEKKALDKQEAENKVKWAAQRAEQETIQNALNAYYKEQNAGKKAVLWKAYLALTKPERDTKAAAKKAEEKRVADGLAGAGALKESDPELWETAVVAAAEATAAQLVGRYFWGAWLKDRSRTVSTWASSASENHQRVQQAVIAIAGICAEQKLGATDELRTIDENLGGYLDTVCAAGGLNSREVVRELYGYAVALVEANWDSILGAGTYLLATGGIKNSRTFRKVSGGGDLQKPAFKFSPALASLTMLLPSQPKPPVPLPQPTSSPQQMSGSPTTAALVPKALVN